MRKFAVLLALVMFGATTVSFAAFKSIARSTYTASVTFNEEGQVSVALELKYRPETSRTGTPTQIEWSGIALGTTKWKCADTYIVMYTTITNATGGIQIYTDNTAADASPRYSGVVTGSNATNPAGLVGYHQDVPSASSSTLAMCWRVVDISTDSVSIVQGTDNKLYDDSRLGGQTGKYPCFLWMKDRKTPAISYLSTTAFADGEDYVTVKEAARGIQHAEGTWGTGVKSPDYVYIGANFADASTPRTYKTSTLRIEAFTE